MEWIKVTDISGNILRIPEDQIDHIVESNKSATALVCLKSGNHRVVDAGSFYKTELRPITDYDPTDLRKEIEDLKLENDRLKRRNELMEDYIHAIACITSKKSKFKGLCDDVSCPYYDHDKGIGKGACQLGSRDLIEQEAADIIEKLEEL